MARKFDVVVVGAGPAGSTAAYTLAGRGFRVLLLERGRVPGSKNMFGGKVYAAPLREVYRDLDEKAPIHRWVVCERVSLTAGGEVVTLERRVGDGRAAFTTFLTQLCGWMASRAEEEGAIVLTEITVDSLYVVDGVVRGVVAGGDRVEADVVIDAEGINRLLLERAGIVRPLRPSQVALGVKEVLKLPREELEAQLGLGEREGLAWVLIGDVTGGIPGGAFVYTQEEAVSIGVVLMLEEAAASLRDHVSVLVERLRTHPLLGRLFEKGTLLEYSAHLIPEDPSALKPPSYSMDGLLIAGDAAGLLINMGYAYRGVDTAAYSGYLAAQAYEKAHGEGRFDRSALSVYDRMLAESFVGRGLRGFRGVRGLMGRRRVFTTYPELVVETLRAMLDSDEPVKLMDALGRAKRGRVGWLTLIRDLVSVVRRL
ncbi:electron transfer flavoprotein-ubiquinone oxidoreductase [Candidatus Geothermarchaeota archaeon ex4572_27]|nr:MAG: electron transfer flavoprotein-ubiquinone oxidoreductase [Candidatus Geothermarchaeota archaeon ex4572_27]